MNSTELFYLALVFGLGAIIGIIISHFRNASKKGKSSNWKLKYEEANSNFINANKSYKAEKKRINQHLQDRDNWKAKYEAIAPIPDQQQSEIAALKANLKDNTNTVDSLESDIKRLTGTSEKMKSDLEKLKEKYATDMHDSKNWKSMRTQFQSDIESLTEDVKQLETNKVDLKKEVLENSKKLEDYELLKKNHRLLNKEKIRLKKDLEYWEKKHYEVHHELTSSTETIKIQAEKAKALEVQIQAQLVEKEKMVQRVNSFKEKYLVAKDRYTALMK